MTEYILITAMNHAVRVAMNDLDGTELVRGTDTAYVWHWVNPAPADLATAQGMTGYIGTVQIA